MEKIMDLEEWEFLPSDVGFIDLDEDGVRETRHSGNRNPNPKNVFDADYFICPSLDPRRSIQPSSPTRRSRVVPTQLVQVPTSWEPIIGDKGLENTDTEKEITKFPVDVKVVTPSKIKNCHDLGIFETDHDTVSQVSFRKMKENEFVDMKMDSPRSTSPRMSSSPTLPQIDATPLTFDDGMERKIQSPRKIEEKNDPGSKEEEFGGGDDWGEESSGKLNIWKLSFTGIGAICSFGVAAAATICIIFLGSNHKNTTQDQRQRLRFQIYTHDKRIKQVVQHATKLNEAISAARGVPVTSAQISFGGYYDGL